MSDVQLTDKMPLDEIQKTVEYARLTPKKRLWVSTYIQSGMEHGDYDPILATRTAFECRSDENARIMSYSILENIHIIEVLNMHFRVDPLDAFIKIIDRAIRNKKISHAQVQALRLKCELLGIANRLPVADGPTEGSPVISDKVAGTPAVSSKPEQRRKHRKAEKPAKNQVLETENPYDRINKKKPPTEA